MEFIDARIHPTVISRTHWKQHCWVFMLRHFGGWKRGFVAPVPFHIADELVAAEHARHLSKDEHKAVCGGSRMHLARHKSADDKRDKPKPPPPKPAEDRAMPSPPRAQKKAPALGTDNAR